jgi:hypothetical protein
MANQRFIVSATIVLIFLSGSAFASPVTGVELEDTSAESGTTLQLDDNLSISRPPSLTSKPPPPDPHYYPYQQALTFRTGYDSNWPKLGVDHWILGFQYLFPKFLSPKLEAGADSLDNGSGHLHAGARWFYNERGYFRPSVKASLDHLAESQHGLATLTKLANYYFRGSATLEWVVSNPASIRLEHEMFFNFDRVRANITLGLSWGF